MEPPPCVHTSTQSSLITSHYLTKTSPSTPQQTQTKKIKAVRPACTHQVNGVASIDLRFTTCVKETEATEKASEAAEAKQAAEATQAGVTDSRRDMSTGVTDS